MFLTVQHLVVRVNARKLGPSGGIARANTRRGSSSQCVYDSLLVENHSVCNHGDISASLCVRMVRY